MHYLLTKLLAYQVKRLSIHSQTLSNLSINHLTNLLNSEHCLIKLKLENVIFENFVSFFQQFSNFSLEILEIQDCPTISKHHLRILIENLNFNCLQELTLSELSLGDDFMQIFGANLQDRGRNELKVLRLVECDLSDEELLLFGSFFSQNLFNFLEELDLSSNQFLEESFLQLCEALRIKRFGALRKLFFAECGLTDACLLELSQSLPYSKITLLYLESNRFTSASVINGLLKLGVENTLTMESIYLDENIEIIDISEALFLNSIRNHPRLSVFSLEGTNVSDALKIKIDQLLSFQQNLNVRIVVLFCALLNSNKIEDSCSSSSVSKKLDKDHFKLLLNLKIIKLLALFLI